MDLQMEPEVAELLSLTVPTVYTYLRRGDLEGIKAGKVWLVPLRSLERFINRQMLAGKRGNR